MKKCELCNFPARMYCESDQASLCWTCDSEVHGANFLVARHCRSLLCHVCQCRTPWSASGSELGPTVSVCRRCVGEGAEKIGIGEDACEETDGGYEAESDSEDKSSFDEEEVSDCDDRDLQPATSSSSSDEETDGDSLKRSRESSSDLRSESVDLEPWNKRRRID